VLFRKISEQDSRPSDYCHKALKFTVKCLNKKSEELESDDVLILATKPHRCFILEVEEISTELAL
jgi:hypothetical protein